MQRTHIEANTEYQRLLARAIADGVVVKTRIADKATGKPLGYQVAGKHGDTYNVTVVDNHLTCTCWQGQHGHKCKHTCACVDHEIRRADAAKATPAPALVLAERVTDEDWTRDRAAAPVVQGAQGVRTLR